MWLLNYTLLSKLLLLQLLTTAPSAAEYRTVIANVAIHSPIGLVTDVENECDCKTKCWLDSDCKAASYDAVADICSMTDGGPDTVTTRPLLDSVAFFKYQFSETPLEIFLTAGTKNGALEVQKALCAAENGIPLIIKTQEAKAEAMELTKQDGGGWRIPGTGLQAWITARNCLQEEVEAQCRWPDGTRLIDAVFTDQDFKPPFASGPSVLFEENGKLIPSVEVAAFEFPVLCSKTLN